MANSKEGAKVQGRVMAAQHAFFRVSVSVEGMCQAAVRERDEQLDHASHLAERAGDFERVRWLQQQREHQGPHELLCRARSLLRKMGGKVVVGDSVSVRGIDWVERRAVVESVAARSRSLEQPPVANFDRVLLVFSLAEPEPDEWQMTKFLLAGEMTGSALTVALTKADLLPERATRHWASKLDSWGYTAIPVSVKTGDGFDEMARALGGGVCVLAGPSGAGKSSVVNRLRLDANGSGLEPEPAVAPWESIKGGGGARDEGKEDTAGVLQSVRAVSKSGAGRHTTRNVSLLAVPQGGLLADTPGLGLPSTGEVAPEEVQALFPEIRRQAPECSFSDCSHRHEPGCGLDASFERYPLYLRYLTECEEAGRARQRTRDKEASVRYKSATGGEAEIEARLNHKRHRRASRRRQRQRLRQRIDDEMSYPS